MEYEANNIPRLSMLMRPNEITRLAGKRWCAKRTKFDSCRGQVKRCGERGRLKGGPYGYTCLTVDAVLNVVAFNG